MIKKEEKINKLQIAPPAHVSPWGRGRCSHEQKAAGLHAGLSAPGKPAACALGERP